ncbi:MAG TPA: hypothetical protein GXX36_13665 [Clostridiaceae bacterium]|nr:hypothetical protein [Clostridiaceae bacterium]
MAETYEFLKETSSIAGNYFNVWMSDCDGMEIGISGANMTKGTNVILWTEASDESQTYIFKKFD